jgi:hypothetical protein
MGMNMKTNNPAIKAIFLVMAICLFNESEISLSQKYDFLAIFVSRPTFFCFSTEFLFLSPFVNRD